MGDLELFHQHKIDSDLFRLADYVGSVGISSTVACASDGSVSLSLALARICGSTATTFVDDFDFLLDTVPAFNRGRFVLCWDALELECGEDIVMWSEMAGTESTVDMIRILAKQILFFTKSA